MQSQLFNFGPRSSTGTLTYIKQIPKFTKKCCRHFPSHTKMVDVHGIKLILKDLENVL
jgi:hypothetical protein